MSFTMESEKQGRFFSLDLQIICEDKTLPPLFTINLPSGVYTHFDSFLPSIYKVGTVYTLAYRCFRICSSWTKLYTELFCQTKWITVAKKLKRSLLS